MKNIEIWAREVPGYKLLDSGAGEKLEEINGIKIVRKEPRAWWGRELASDKWQGASRGLETVLDLEDLGVKCKIKFKEGSKHIGIFPEQFTQWQWLAKKLKSGRSENNKQLKVLNLFGYTGIASLVAAKSGAEVTHVDASKQSIDWARENQKLSGLENAPIRWIVDDVVKFLKREIKRGEKYDVIIMDPPSYGKGPKGEVWKIEEKLDNLLLLCKELLSDDPLFIILNMYSTELSAVSTVNILSDITKNLGGNIKAGELAIPQENFSSALETARLLPMSIFAIWEK
jgi:23S rRNA (cytosine1962-C5)-methyltransferase